MSLKIQVHGKSNLMAYAPVVACGRASRWGIAIAELAQEARAQVRTRSVPQDKVLAEVAALKPRAAMTESHERHGDVTGTLLVQGVEHKDRNDEERVVAKKNRTLGTGREPLQIVGKHLQW